MIKPHGADVLLPRLVTDVDKRRELLAEARELPSLLLNSAAAANAVMLGGGYFTPLTGFMNLADSLSVAKNMQTTDGLFWPVPVMNLAVDVSSIEGAARIALRDPNVEGNPLMAIMDVAAVEDVAEDQLDTMTEQVYGTQDRDHPGVAVFRSLGNYCISGPVQVLNLIYFPTVFVNPFKRAGEKAEEPLESYFSANEARLDVTTAKPGKFHIFDLSADRTEVSLVKTLDVGEGAHHVAFAKDGRDAWVQNSFINLPGMSEGSISVIDMQSLTVVDTINTFIENGFNPNCMVLLPEWNHPMGH